MLMAIGCDETNVNTGATGGVIRLLEQQFRRPLQWLVCLLHASELPLRHLIKKLDGVTQGPSGFSGVIGKALTTCEDLPIMQFSPIQLENCPCLDDVELSTDQQYLYDMSSVISSGHWGVVAGRVFFYKNEFVVEYAGQLVNRAVAKSREAKYSANEKLGCYMYYFMIRSNPTGRFR